MSFAAVACVEHAKSSSNPPHLSAQFLYWAIKSAHDSNPHIDGTLLEYAEDALASHGVPNESDWPYDPIPQAGNISHDGSGKPTANAIANALKNRVQARFYQVFAGLGGGAAPVLALLQQGRPVAVTVPVFRDPQGVTDKSVPLTAASSTLASTR